MSYFQANSHHVPSIQEYKAIQNKVSNLEQAHKTQVAHLQDKIAQLESEKVKVVMADDMVVKKYKDQLLAKNIQIERFQNEIDSIMSLCLELQANGIILPER